MVYIVDKPITSRRLHENFDHLEVNNFLNKFSRTNLFHSPRYLKFVANLIGCESRFGIAYDAKNQITGVLPYSIMNGKFGMLMNSSPYYGSNGGIITDCAETFETLLNFWRDKARQMDASTLITSPFFKSPTLESFDYVSSRVTHVNNLNIFLNEEELMNSFHQKTRNAVRKSMKSGFILKQDDNDWRTLFRIHSQNMIEIGGTAKDKMLYEGISKKFKPGVDYKIFYVIYQGQKVAGILLFYFNKTIEYYTPVVEKKYRDLQPLSFLIFSLMLEHLGGDYSYWNWGGSWPTQTNLVRFKRRWGGEEYTYNYLTTLNNKAILGSTVNELLNEYPNFFVVPFEALNPES